MQLISEQITISMQRSIIHTDIMQQQEKVTINTKQIINTAIQKHIVDMI